MDDVFRCRACEHQNREALDLALSNGMLLKAARRMFGVDEVTLRLHRDDHLKDVVLHIQTDPIRLVRIAQDMTELARSVVEMAVADETDKRALLPGIKTVLECLRFEAELTGAHRRFDPKILMPMWSKLQQRLVVALEDYPEAREAVLKAIADLDVDDEQKRLM